MRTNIVAMDQRRRDFVASPLQATVPTCQKGPAERLPAFGRRTLQRR